MEYTKLGQSELTVSRICLGCMGFGDPLAGQHRWTVDRQATEAIIAHSLERGINFFDTPLPIRAERGNSMSGGRCAALHRGRRMCWPPSFCRARRRSGRRASAGRRISRTA